MYVRMSTQSGSGSEASLTGTFGVSLTRAVLPYPDHHELSPPGGRIQDIGLGVVIDGTDPARADVLDLGSAELRIVNLSGPLALLGWLYPSGLRSLQRAVEDAGTEDLERARSFTFQMALQALQSIGFGPLTRPTLLRVGFRDVCQDLDWHESTAVRLLLPSGGVVRLHLDYESGTLIANTGRSSRSAELESALAEAFPGRELLRGLIGDPVRSSAYHVPFPLPRNLSELREGLARIRKGLVQLLGRFEPDRHASLSDLNRAFGARDSLHSLQDRTTLPRLERVSGPGSPGVAGLRGIH